MLEIVVFLNLLLCFLNLKVIAPFVSVRGYWNSAAVGAGLECGWGCIGCTKVLLEDLTGDGLGWKGFWTPFFYFSCSLSLLPVIVNDYSLASVCRIFEKHLWLKVTGVEGGIFRDFLILLFINMCVLIIWSFNSIFGTWLGFSKLQYTWVILTGRESNKARPRTKSKLETGEGLELCVRIWLNAKTQALGWADHSALHLHNAFLLQIAFTVV